MQGFLKLRNLLEDDAPLWVRPDTIQAFHEAIYDFIENSTGTPHPAIRCTQLICPPAVWIVRETHQEIIAAMQLLSRRQEDRVIAFHKRISNSDGEDWKNS